MTETDTMLEGLKAAQKELATVVDRICTENKIRYYLAYGTLIGAMRHNGFIPWDDDIDIMMPYPDLLKFQEACKTQLPDGYFYQSPETEREYRLTIHRICKDNTVLLESNMANKDVHHGIFLDIYPLFGAAPTPKKRKKQVTQAMKRALYLLGEPVRNHGLIMKLGSTVLLRLKSKRGAEKAQKKLFAQISAYPYDQSEYVTALNSSTKEMRTSYRREWFGEGQRHVFEDTQFIVPNDSDSILRKFYGDYMQLPPENERKAHHDFIDVQLTCSDKRGHI